MILRAQLGGLAGANLPPIWRRLGLKHFLACAPAFLRQERTGASATTPAVNDGDPIGSWYDAALGAWWTVPTADSKRPVLRKRNNRLVAEFSAASAMTLASPAGSNAFGNAKTGYTFGAFLELKNYAQRNVITSCTTASGGTRMYLRSELTSGMLRINGRRLDGDTQQHLTTGAAAGLTAQHVCARIDFSAGPNASIFKDDSSAASGTILTTGTTSATNGNAVPHLGSEIDADGWCDAYIGDFYASDTFITDAQRQALHGWMKLRYRL